MTKKKWWTKLFFSVITKTSIWEVLTKSLFAFKRQDGVKDENFNIFGVQLLLFLHCVFEETTMVSSMVSTPPFLNTSTSIQSPSLVRNMCPSFFTFFLEQKSQFFDLLIKSFKTSDFSKHVPLMLWCFIFYLKAF